MSSSSSAISSLSHGRRPPAASVYFTFTNISTHALVAALSALASDVLAATAAAPVWFQRRNFRSLRRKLVLLSAFFDFLRDSFPRQVLPPPAILCLRELYIVVYRAKLLLEYCLDSGQIWILLLNPQISGKFHDLVQELTLLLDVLPLDDLPLAADVCQQMELLRRQCRSSKLKIDSDDEELRRKINSFLSDFKNGTPPDPVELQKAFVLGLGIRDDGACLREIEFLEDRICSRDEDVNLSIAGGVVALTSYCRYLLFAFQEVNFGEAISFKSDHGNEIAGRLTSQGSNSSLAAPKDFYCSISLDLMKDPVIVSTGQTYDRASITHWIEEGHSTCPNSGQVLANKMLLPNRALQSLIFRWCSANDIYYETPESVSALSESINRASANKAAIQVYRAAAEILVQYLLAGTEDAKTIAAHELRLLSKTGKVSRAYITDLGAIPLLCRLLKSKDPFAQENAVTAILNLSIHDNHNKKLIVEEQGCLALIVYVLRHGQTMEARENAAATLFSLCYIHDYKLKILNEPFAVKGLANLLMNGSLRGRKDAVLALYNLCTHPESWTSMLYMGGVSALMQALRDEALSEEAAGGLAFLVKQPFVTDVVGSEDDAIFDLTMLMKRGSPKGKENAVVALLEMCHRGSLALRRRVAGMPELSATIQSILFTGTNRARRKATLLAKMCRQVTVDFNAGWAVDQTLARTSSLSSSFGSGDASVAVAMVPVL